LPASYRREATLVARVRREPNLLAVTFERDGEEPRTLFVEDSALVAIAAIGFIMTAHGLHDGDRIAVTAADKLDEVASDERERLR
jgi:hypothetical protein